MIKINYLKDYKIQSSFLKIEFNDAIIDDIGFSFLYYNLLKLAEIYDVYNWNDKKIHKKYNFKFGG